MSTPLLFVPPRLALSIARPRFDAFLAAFDVALPREASAGSPIDVARALWGMPTLEALADAVDLLDLLATDDGAAAIRDAARAAGRTLPRNLPPADLATVPRAADLAEPQRRRRRPANRRAPDRMDRGQLRHTGEEGPAGDESTRRVRAEEGLEDDCEVRGALKKRSTALKKRSTAGLHRSTRRPSRSTRRQSRSVRRPSRLTRRPSRSTRRLCRSARRPDRSLR